MTRVGAVLMTWVAGLTLAGCGGAGGHTTPAGATAARGTGTTAARATGTTSAVAHPHHRAHRLAPHRPAPDPGRLPQTDRRPSSQTPAFHAEMQALWTAVLSGRTAGGRAAFFPEPAYDQVKAIGDAPADWRYRLYADYGLDIAAAHRLLGTPSAGTHLIGVSVPGQYSHWVAPEVCENRVGYYEVPNARMVYREHGVVRSFGIASMISWRGRWYVIHLGYEGKLSIGGRVDAPSAGVGVSAPSDAC